MDREIEGSQVKTHQNILDFLSDLLSDFQGRTYDDEISQETMFFQDLGFSSIDAIVLGETLESQFGCKLPFNKFLAKLSESGATDVSVGELTEFLTSNLPSGN